MIMIDSKINSERTINLNSFTESVVMLHLLWKDKFSSYSKVTELLYQNNYLIKLFNSKQPSRWFKMLTFTDSNTQHKLPINHKVTGPVVNEIEIKSITDSSFMYEKIFASPFAIWPFCSKIFDQCCSLLVAVVDGCHESSVSVCDFLMWNYVMQQCQFDCVCMVYTTQNWIQLNHK